MNKFDNIIKNFLTEGDLSLTPSVINTAQKGLQSVPSNVKDALASISNIIDPNNANPLHKKLSDILDPSTKTDISVLNDQESQEAIALLTKAGFPISLNNNKEEEEDKKDIETSEPNTMSTSSSTSYKV